MRKNTLNMKSLMEDINRTSKLLKKSYLFEDYEEDPRMRQRGGMPQDDMNMMGGQDMEMEEENQIDEQTVDVINQIRELAIQGIAQFANDVESEQYQALKKIWLLTDKFYETANNEDEGKKKI